MLDRIIGNEGLKAALGAVLGEGRLPHSLLLLGEEGCGAGFAARCIAADLLFPRGGAAAQAVVDGQTSQAVVNEKDREGRILTGQVREVITAQGGGKGGKIQIGAVRALRTEMFNTALTGEERAAIFYHAQDLNPNSANALLKILEEPPPHTHFLLTAPSAAALLPTIRSRCAQYTLGPVSEAECAAYLRRHCPACKEPELLAAVFGGCIGRAVKASVGPTAALFADAQALARATAAGQEYARLVLLAGYEKDRPAAQGLLELFVSLCDAALTRPGLMGLTPQGAARAIPLAAGARQALAGYRNTKLTLTCLGLQLAACAG